MKKTIPVLQNDVHERVDRLRGLLGPAAEPAAKPAAAEPRAPILVRLVDRLGTIPTKAYGRPDATTD